MSWKRTNAKIQESEIKKMHVVVVLYHSNLIILFQFQRCCRDMQSPLNYLEAFQGPENSFQAQGSSGMRLFIAYMCK